MTTDTTIVAEESRFRHLLENLFANSVEHGSTGPASQARQDSVEHGSAGSQTQSDDAIDHGGEDVSITVGRLDDGFYVADDGAGIPEAERDRVFRVGYSTGESGTGFGLNIVKQVAEAHGWSIRVTEGDEGGARFEITGVEFVEENGSPSRG